MENKSNILVIDDDQDIGRMLKMLLEFKGFNVSIAENKTKADDILKNTRTNIMIMDMLLSGENGINVCSDFKSNDEIKHIPILMMSAHPDAKKICLDAGANDFISKPFEMQDMLLKIEVLLNERVKNEGMKESRS